MTHFQSSIFCCIALTFIPVAFAQSNYQDGFQGMPWGTTEKQIQTKYVGKLKKGECTGFLAKAKAELNQACDNPYIDPYEVAGVPFKLDLALDPHSRTLVAVSLYYSGKLSHNLNETTESLWRFRYDRIYKALTEKYGKPEDISTYDERGYFIAIVQWINSDTVIRLSSELNPDQIETHELTYRPRGSGDASKL